MNGSGLYGEFLREIAVLQFLPWRSAKEYLTARPSRLGMSAPLDEPGNAT
jgi:hypothetical protein